MMVRLRTGYVTNKGKLVEVVNSPATPLDFPVSITVHDECQELCLLFYNIERDGSKSSREHWHRYIYSSACLDTK